MKLLVNKWAVAFINTKGELFNVTSEFLSIDDNYKNYIADPFLFDYQENTYLFVELFDYKIGRGTIAYAKYYKKNNSFGRIREIISENYHLSYPLVFDYKGEIYLMPEANESNSLYIYKATSFPEKWEKHAVLLENIKYVDTTPFVYNSQFYAITKDNSTPQAPMFLLKIDPEKWSVVEKKEITDDVSFSRPGGKVFQKDGKYYMVTQDCEADYGAALNILSFTIDEDMNMSYHLEKKITPAEVSVKGIDRITGIHTYNFTEELEVIDYKRPQFAFYRRFCKLINRLKGK